MAMHDIVDRGKALYWGTSEWHADEIRAAWEIAERHHLHKPVMEQPQYNLFERKKVEKEYRAALRRHRPRPHHVEPAGVRAAHREVRRRRARVEPGDAAGLRWLRDIVTDPESNRKVRELKLIADRLGCTLAQLAIAWCAANPRVSTVITGASRVEQVHENLGALDVIPALDDDLRAEIDTLTR